MSTLPPERPTERIPPLTPTPPPLVQEHVVAPAVDPNLILVRLEDAVASLRTWLTIVGLLAVVALGVAIYGLTRDAGTSGGSRSGLATDKRVTRVNDRVDRLSGQVQTLRASRTGNSGGASTTALSDRLDTLESTVRTLSSRPSTDATQAVKDLSDRIDTLSRDVDALKQQAQTTP